MSWQHGQNANKIIFDAYTREGVYLYIYIYIYIHISYWVSTFELRLIYVVLGGWAKHYIYYLASRL
jgi:hypothetical protein